MTRYNVYAEDVTDKSRRYLGKAVGDNIGKGLFDLYADECGNMEEIIIVPVEMSASEIGRKGGQAKSDRKAAAVRENGKKGGRPAYAVERYTSTVFSFSSASARDAWVSERVDPEREIRNEINLKDALKLRDRENFVKFLPWQEAELLK